MIPPTKSLYPPHRAISVREARAADLSASLKFGIPSLVLMEHAGRGLAELVAVVRGASSGPVAILCGPGQNGGDGLACARFLRSFEIPFIVARLGSRPPDGDAGVELAALVLEADVSPLIDEAGVAAWACRAFDGASVIVDALFGMGLDRPLDAASVCAVRAMNEARGLRVAVDIPSGLDATSGRALPVAVRADVTAAMGFVKHGCRTEAGAPYCGRIVEIDIGLPHAIHGPYGADRPTT